MMPARTIRRFTLPLCLAAASASSLFGQELLEEGIPPLPPPVEYVEPAGTGLLDAETEPLVPPLPEAIDEIAESPAAPLPEESPDAPVAEPAEAPVPPAAPPQKTKVADPLGELASQEEAEAKEDEAAKVAAKPEELELPSVLAPNREPLQPIGNGDLELIDPESVEVVKQRYPDGKVKLAYEVARDANDNFVKHGDWKLFNLEGEVIAQGQYRNNEQHGRWQRWHNGTDSELFLEEPYTQFTPPYFSETDFQHDQLHGIWSIRDSQGRTISEIEFRDGVRHGKATWWHANGNLMQEISFADGEIHGDLFVFTSDGRQRAHHIYKHGRREAAMTTKFANGQKKSEGQVLHAATVITEPDDWWNAKTAVFTKQGADEKHGLWRQWHPNGTLHVEGTYDHSLEDGKFTWWYASGQKALAGTYVAGNRDGQWCWWHENGQKQAEGTFSEGEAIATWIWWNEDGTVARRAVAGEDDPASRTAEGTGTGVRPTLFERGLLPTPIEAQ